MGGLPLNEGSPPTTTTRGKPGGWIVIWGS